MDKASTSPPSQLRSFVIGCGALLTVASNAARADQGGVPFWLSGQFASLAAVPATPGWSLTATPYYYNGNANAAKSFQIGETLAAGVSTSVSMLLFQAGYAGESQLLGGQPYIGLGWGPGRNRTSVDVTMSQPARERTRNDSITGGTDLYPYASLAWTRGSHNWMTYLTGGIPLGAYRSSRLSNLGLGHGAIDAGGGYTYLDGTTGREFSAVAGATYNWENTQTDYQNGIDSHVDWAVSQFLSENWQVGIAGYVYYQLTGDSGSGNKVGSFESRVAAVGPQVGYAFKFNGQPAYFNLRSYWEFWAQNRVEGYAIFATLGIPLGSASQ